MWLWKRKSDKEQEGDKAVLPVIKRVLLIVGGSVASQAAMSFALEMAKRTGASLYATYVIDTDSLDFLMSKRIFVEEECKELGRDLEQKGTMYLEKIRGMAAEQEVPVETELVQGRFVKTVVGMVRNQQIDLLVLGSWKNEGSSKDLYARVRQTVVETVACPVAVIKGQ